MKRYIPLIAVLCLLVQSCSTGPSLNSKESNRRPASFLKNCNELLNEVLQNKFVVTRRKFVKALKKEFPERKAKIIEKNLDALLFIDYSHSYPLLRGIHMGGSNLFEESIFDLYADSGGSRVFQNYLKATKYLFENKPSVNSSSLKKAHSIMMGGGIDDIPAERVGTFREEDIIGNVPEGYEINKKQMKALEENPYINTSRLEQNSNGFHGYIGYPNAQYNTPDIMKMIKKSNRDLHDEIVDFQAGRGGDFEELTGRLVNQLTEDLLDWFVKQKDQIGKVNSVAKLKKYARLVARFQRDLVSIHPFYDGNGRTIRQFALYYPFWLEGLPPPRMSDVNNDIYSTLDDWTEQILEGVYASHSLYSSMTARLDNTLRLGTTPELLYPQIPKKYKRTFRSQKPRRTIKEKETVEIDPAQFAEFVNTKTTADKNILARFKEDPHEVLEEMTGEYLKFIKSSTMHYRHSKFGDEYIGLSLVDQDFAETFANHSYRNKADWDYKMERWYKDDVVWRGLSRQELVEEEEIVSMFSDLHYQFVSNRTMSFTNNEERLADEIMKDWEDYNEDIVNGGIVRMAKDHSESGELYGVSYGYSTSKKWEVGRAFAMGAMVVAEYGQHWDYQHLLKSRVLVGMKQAAKDVELSRLKQLRPEFSYKYPRQVEVMGIGAADPDSVMFVQLIDEEGDAFLSYVRNPKKPNEILVFEGDVRDLDNLPSRPARKIRLP